MRKFYSATWIPHPYLQSINVFDPFFFPTIDFFIKSLFCQKFTLKSQGVEHGVFLALISNFHDVGERVSLIGASITFTRATIRPKCVPFITSTFRSSRLVDTQLFTTSIIHFTLVNICQWKGEIVHRFCYKDLNIDIIYYI